MVLFLESWIITGCVESKRKFPENPSHNILAFFNNLARVWIPTSKTILDIYHNKLVTRAASRVAERLAPRHYRRWGGFAHIRKKKRLRILENYEKLEKCKMCPVFFPEIKRWKQLSKKHAKIDIIRWSLVQFYCISLLCSKYFVEDCSFDLSTANSIWYIRFASFWDHFNPSVTFRTRYANLGLFRPNFINNDIRTKIKISEFVQPVLRTQYICLKVSIKHSFHHFLTICTWCTN